MKLDSDTKTVMKELIEDGFFLPKKMSIDISKFLDENKQLDLWLLEVAVRNSIRFIKHATGRTEFREINGLLEYCSIREVEFGGRNMYEEFRFFQRFIASIINDELNQ